jgi:hypothetical protein
MLISAIYADRDVKDTASATLPSFPFDIFTDATTREDRDGGQLEVLQSFSGTRVRSLFGGGLYRVTGDIDVDIDSCPVFGGVPDCSFPLTLGQRSSLDGRAASGYNYTYVDWPEATRLTFGLGLDRYATDAGDQNRVSPKFGVEWDALPSVTLRGAAFRTVQKPLIVDQTIEPTQVAGFSQLNDEFDGTTAEVVGVGLDLTLSRSLRIGAEATRRWISAPRVEISNGDEEQLLGDAREDRLGGYAYWTVTDRVVVGFEPGVELFRQAERDSAGLPKEVRTLELPLTLRFFDPSGLFVMGGINYVRQNVERLPTTTTREGDNDFILVDAAVGFRFPNRRGIISLEGRNLLGEHFKYQDDGFRTRGFRADSGAQYIRFFPERSVLARLTLNF